MPAAPPQHAEKGMKAPRLSPRNWARVEGWGMAVSGLCWLLRPRRVDDVATAFDIARAHELSVALRGAGRSYGDAALNSDGIVLDLSRLDRILDWNPDTGIVDVEPGVTIEKLWKHIIVDGWWPPVVSGTMFTTMGGCAAMNIHGKNNYCMGPFGDHVLEFDLLTPAGESLTCSRKANADLFHAAIAGFGMLGVMTRLRLKMKKVYSGRLMVEAFDTASLPAMIDDFEDRADTADYLVGWVDAIAGGDQLGRGVVHRADYLADGVDKNPRESLRVRAQELPNSILGMPKSLLWWPLGWFNNDIGMRAVNTAKILASRFVQPRGHVTFQSHAGFAFLLDYVPNWKWAYKPGGLIQYQSFIPRAAAADVFEELLRRTQHAKLPSYLGVFKKHRPDDFLLTHAVDGYSLALDFRVTARNRERLWKLCHEMDNVVLDAGGRFYFAKDATLRRGAAERFLPPDNLAKFRALKRRCDPHNLLQTDLSRRVFGEEI